jgi:hypothetical protein
MDVNIRFIFSRNSADRDSNFKIHKSLQSVDCKVITESNSSRLEALSIASSVSIYKIAFAPRFLANSTSVKRSPNTKELLNHTQDYQCTSSAFLFLAYALALSSGKNGLRKYHQKEYLHFRKPLK